MIFLIKKSVAKEILKSLGKNKLEELKREVIEILKKQDEKEYKKALSHFENEEKNMSYLEKSISGEWIEKAGYGIGTVRVWKGKKYKKIAPGKWARMYEKEGRGTNIAVGHLIAKVKKIDDIEELMNFVMQNKQRFQDENGMDLPILDKIRAEVDRQSGKIESKGKSENTEKKDLKPNKYDKATIQKMGNKYYVYTEEGGREVEKFNTKKEAEDYIKRQRLIQNEKNLIGEDGYAKMLDKLNESTEKEDETKVAIKGKFATDKQIDYVTEVSDKTILSTEKMLKKPITTIQRYAISNVEDFKGGVDRFIEYMADRQSEISLDEIAKEWARLVNHNVARKIWESYQGGALEINDDGYFQEKKEEKQQNNKQGKIPSGYVNDLSIEKQGELHKLLREHFKKEGMSGMEIADALDNAMDSKISDLEEIYNTNKEVKELLMNTDSDSSSFKLSDIYDRNTHDEMKQVQSFDEAKHVIKQIADNYGPTEKGRKLLENFMSYNVGGSSPIYDKVYEHFGISYNDLDADFDAAKNKILKLASGQKNVSKEDKKIQQGKDDFASRYRAAIEQEDKNFQKNENSKNSQNQMTPKQQKTFDDFEKKAIKKAGSTERGKLFAKHNYNIDGEDWTITTDGRVMLCSREKFEEPTKTDKITNMDKVFVINGQKESAIPDGIDAIIKAAPKTVVTGKDYKGKEKKEPSIIKLGDRYFNTDYLKSVQNFLGPLSNVKMQVIPGDNKSRVKFESGNKAVVLLPIENGAELENRIINTNDIKKSLEDIIMFCNDFEDEDEVIEEINNVSLFSDYSAENPSEFNSIKYKVANAFEECGY